MGTFFSAPKIDVYDKNIHAHKAVKRGKKYPFVLVTYLPKAGNIKLEYDKRLELYTNNKEKLDKIQALPLPHVRIAHYEIDTIADVCSIVKDLEHEPGTTVNGLVDQLLNRGKDKLKQSGDAEKNLTDADKVRLLYYWLTSQDVRMSEYCVTANVFSIEYQLRDLCKKKNSYAALFSLMCSYADIPCVVVHGCVKGGHYYPGYKNLWSKLVREWNAVLVDGQWRLVDALLGATTQTTNTGNIEPCTDPWYMFPNPEELIYTHYPFNEKWQLLATPLTKGEFEEQALLKRRFFELGMGFEESSPRHGLVVSKTGEVDLILDNSSPGHHFETVVSRYNPASKAWQNMEVTTVDLKRKTGVQFSVKAIFYQKGSFKLDIVGKKASSNVGSLADYDWIAIYNVIIETPVDMGWGPTEYMSRFGLNPLSHKKGTTSCEPEEPMVFVFKVSPEMIKSISLSFVVVDSENHDVKQGEEQTQFLPNSDGTVNIPVTVDSDGEFSLKISASVNGVNSGVVVKYKMIGDKDDPIEKVKEVIELLNKSLASRKRDEIKKAVKQCDKLGVSGHSRVRGKYKAAHDILTIPEITRNVIHNVKLVYFTENPSDDVVSVVNATLVLLGFNRLDTVSQHDFSTLISKFDEFSPDNVTNEMCMNAEEKLGAYGDLERVVKQNKHLAAFGSWLLSVFDVKGYVRQMLNTKD